jgi:hypothetical protein
MAEEDVYKTVSVEDGGIVHRTTRVVALSPLYVRKNLQAYYDVSRLYDNSLGVSRTVLFVIEAESLIDVNSWATS